MCGAQSRGCHTTQKKPTRPPPTHTRTGYATGARERARHPSLIHGGSRLGQSRVQFASPWRMKAHALMHDFFVSTLQLSLSWLLLAVAALYLFIFVVFAALWWAAWNADPRCLSASQDSGRTFATAFLFSIAKTQTIGEGVWCGGHGGLGGVKGQNKKNQHHPPIHPPRLRQHRPQRLPPRPPSPNHPRPGGHRHGGGRHWARVCSHLPPPAPRAHGCYF